MSKLTVFLFVALCVVVSHAHPQLTKKPDTLAGALDSLKDHIKKQADEVGNVIDKVKQEFGRSEGVFEKSVKAMMIEHQSLTKRIEDHLSSDHMAQKDQPVQTNKGKPKKGCADGWSLKGMRCLKYFGFTTATGSVDDAKTSCEANGANLASVRNQVKNDFVRDLAPNTIKFIIIGFTDKAKEGKFVWPTAGKIDYDNFDAGEPNDAGGDEDCVVMLRDVGYTWNDFRCDKPLNKDDAGYVCQKKATMKNVQKT